MFNSSLARRRQQLPNNSETDLYANRIGNRFVGTACSVLAVPVVAELVDNVMQENYGIALVHTAIVGVLARSAIRLFAEAQDCQDELNRRQVPTPE